MRKYQQFAFKDYSFDAANKQLKMFYGYDNQLEFCETYKFKFEFVDYDEQALDRACQILFFMAGVSYYKAFVAPEIVVNAGQIDKNTAEFLAKTYQKGLGEFFYLNDFDPQTEITFPVNSAALTPIKVNSSGPLIGIGGGKDSLVSVGLLRNQPKAGIWSVSRNPEILRPLLERIDLPNFSIERDIDLKLYELNKQGAYNGHIPLSAILACLGTVVAVLSGHRDIVVSNESSANEPNLHYKGVAINHQYSKSLEFEQDYQKYLVQNFGDSIRYYSFLRPLTELRIAEIFSKHDYENYKGVFSSCNRAFRWDSKGIFWCGECPKCAFVFLALTPFLPRQELESLWHGKNLLLDPSLEPTYRQLLGIEGNKPLDCVGEVKESRSAMDLARKIYPELKKYQYEIPRNYDYKNVSPHSMPPEIFETFKSSIR
jgi:hypothetical protein